MYAKLSGHHAGTINDAVYLPEKGCMISIGEDKTVLCWLRRDGGQFWPSISQPLPSAASCMHFHAPTRRLFVGMESGNLLDYIFSEDFNTLQLQRSIHAHTSRVSAVGFDASRLIILSCARDKAFAAHNALSGAVIGKHKVDAWYSSLQYDETTQNAFVGDYKGNIHIVKVAENKVTPVSVLTGHAGSVRCLLWVPSTGFLFSGSFDKTVIAWDIGGQKGRMLELSYHSEPVTGLVFLEATNELVSSDEKSVVVWDMTADRQEIPDWKESDVCELCKKPFAWNFSEMWQRKSVSMARQHHCRCCGKAVCATCSPVPSAYPRLGFEKPAIMCKVCFPTITAEMKKPLAKFIDQRRISVLRITPRNDFVVTVTQDNTMVVWKLSDFLQGSSRAAAGTSGGGGGAAAAAAAAPTTTTSASSSSSSAAAGARSTGAAAAAGPATIAPTVYSTSGPSKPKANLLDSILDD